MALGLGGHEVLRHLGDGGMGSVWLARRGPGAPFVALKTMRRDQAADRRVRKMFEREMRLAASIVHRHVAAVLETGADAEGTPYLVLEYVDGLSLRALGQAAAPFGGIDLGVALHVVRDACFGLHAAHELRGSSGAPLQLVHRDVSPHNILVSRAGVAKVIDFGIAKVRAATTGDTTSSGSMKGKVRYMAPEQALGRPVDRRADVFALGAVLWELVLGAPVFAADNDLALLRLLVSQAPVVVPADVAAPIASILRGALAKAPRDRFATAADMAAAIDEAIAVLGVERSEADVAALVAALAPPPPEAPCDDAPTIVSLTAPTRRRWRPLAASGAAAAVLAIVLGGGVLARTAAAEERPPLALAAPAAAPIAEAAREPAAVEAAPIAEAAREPAEVEAAPIAEAPARAPARRASERPRRGHANAKPSPSPARGGDDMATALRDRR